MTQGPSLYPWICFAFSFVLRKAKIGRLGSGGPLAVKHMGEQTKRQTEGEAKNFKKENHKSLSVTCFLALGAVIQASPPVQERDLAEMLCQESFP